jgi:nucleotide-binding universal stress UspA family protein
VKAKKILLPIDFSPSSDEAVEAASMLAKGADGEILIVYVEELPIHEDSGYLYRVPPPDTEESLARLKEVVPTEKVPYQHRILKGPVVEAILDFADAEQIDVIVMGTHGRRGLTALVMGSVAEAIVRRAKCPVLVVKDVPEGDEA